MLGLHPTQLAHYALIVSFYPSMAVAWVLGAVNALLYLIIGASGIHVPANLWLALYADATALQMLLYLSGRRHNVSPYERAGSTGITGMLMSVLASPLYASAMVATLFKRPTRFVVTPKGHSATVDNFATFRRHVQWGLLFAAALVASVLLNHVSPMVCFWPSVALLVCLAPVGLWRAQQRGERRAIKARAAITVVAGEGTALPASRRVSEALAVSRHATPALELEAS
jgi:hypothetical protein